MYIGNIGIPVFQIRPISACTSRPLQMEELNALCPIVVRAMHDVHDKVAVVREFHIVNGTVMFRLSVVNSNGFDHLFDFTAGNFMARLQCTLSREHVRIDVRTLFFSQSGSRVLLEHMSARLPFTVAHLAQIVATSSQLGRYVEHEYGGGAISGAGSAVATPVGREGEAETETATRGDATPPSGSRNRAPVPAANGVVASSSGSGSGSDSGAGSASAAVGNTASSASAPAVSTGSTCEQPGASTGGAASMSHLPTPGSTAGALGAADAPVTRPHVATAPGSPMLQSLQKLCDYVMHQHRAHAEGASLRIRRLEENVRRLQIAHDESRSAMQYIESALFGQAPCASVSSPRAWSDVSHYEFEFLRKCCIQAGLPATRTLHIQRYTSPRAEQLYRQQAEIVYSQVESLMESGSLEMQHLPHCLRIGGKENQYLLWRNYLPSEEERLRFRWTPEPIAEFHAPGSQGERGCHFCTKLAEGRQLCHLRPDSRCVLLVRCMLGNGAPNPSRMRTFHHSCLKSHDVIVLRSPELAMPAYLIRFD